MLIRNKVMFVGLKLFKRKFSNIEVNFLKKVVEAAKYI